MARLTYVNDFVTYLVLTYVKSRVTCAACFKLNHVPLTRGGSSVPQTMQQDRTLKLFFIATGGGGLGSAAISAQTQRQ